MGGSDRRKSPFRANVWPSKEYRKMSTIETLMTTEMISAAPDESVLAVIDRMARNRIGAVLVLDGARLSGIFSERDLLTRVIGEKSGGLGGSRGECTVEIIYVFVLASLAVALGVAGSIIYDLKARTSRLNYNVDTLSKLCSRLSEAVRQSATGALAERLDDLAATVDHNLKIHQRFAGRVWQRLGRDQEKDEEEPSPVDDQARRDALRRELLPKSMDGKIAAMTRGRSDD
jgi:CBS domain-containing protein